VEGSKLIVVQDWPIPTIIKQLRGFLGLMWYYYHFVKGYDTLDSPLTDLLTTYSFL